MKPLYGLRYAGLFLLLVDAFLIGRAYYTDTYSSPIVALKIALVSCVAGALALITAGLEGR